MRAALEQAVTLHERARDLAAAGRLRSAARAARRAAALFRAHVGPRSPDLANALLEGGRILRAMGDIRGAEREFRATLRVLRGRPSRGDVMGIRAGAIAGVGACLRERGDYRTAAPLLERAQRLAERYFGADAPELIAFLNERGVLCKFSGRFALGERLYRRALALSEQAFGADHPAQATLYHNLGGLEHARGRYDRAEPLARKSVELRRRKRSPGHPEVAADEVALAAILERTGHRDEAEQLYRRALRNYRRRHGRVHYEVAVVLEGLAGLQRGRAAEQCYREALAIKQQLFGETHPELAVTLNNLGVHYLDGGDRRAASLLERALALFSPQLGARHPSTITCRRNLELARCLEPVDPIVAAEAA
jgi:tetratricopeptide (TPR) repeat protein